MRSKMWPLGDEPARGPREEVRVGSKASEALSAGGIGGIGGGGLPRWESFPPQDRRLLVGLLIHTARQRLQHESVGRLGGERR